MCEKCSFYYKNFAEFQEIFRNLPKKIYQKIIHNFPHMYCITKNFGINSKVALFNAYWDGFLTSLAPKNCPKIYFIFSVNSWKNPNFNL